ncbi:hypothetical protein HN747_01425 [archaeon]|jgi:hypothetical protein|nr:hypothetical protein [archaeon]
MNKKHISEDEAKRRVVGMAGALTMLTAAAAGVYFGCKTVDRNIAKRMQPEPQEQSESVGVNSALLKQIWEASPEYHSLERTNNAALVKNVQNVINFYGGDKAPITADQIIASSRKTGVPIDMYLVSGAQEGHFGTRGRAAETRNIYNVGNVDNGTNSHQNSWETGLDKFGSVIATQYFPGETASLEKFIERDFKRADGARYMTNKNSKESYKSISKRVKRMLNE